MYIIFLINFLLAISTTIGMTIIPFLITDSLGLSLLVLGLLEGTSEFLSNVFRLANGLLFDKIKNKRLIFVSSTAMALISKTLLFLPISWAVLFSKILERIANGMFASPRDAYVATKAKNKGMALGLLNVSKTAGCILGPLVVSASTLFLGNLKDNLHYLVVLCCLLAFPAFVFSFTLNLQRAEKTSFSVEKISTVLKNTMPILIISFLFFMGRFNDGLLMMYLKHKNFPEWFYLSTIAIFNAIMLISSPLIGASIDKGHLKTLVYITIGTLLFFNVCFYGIDNMTWHLAILGIISWGIQRACAQIVFASLIFKRVQSENYGTAIGLVYIFSGMATMISSFCCGFIANTHFSYVFIFSGFFSILALFITMGILTRKIFTFDNLHFAPNPS